MRHKLGKKMSEQDEQVLETTNSNEELELETELDNGEDVDALKEELEKANLAKQQILARAKKAEAELKTLKTESATQNINNTNTLTAEDIDVKILKAQGLSEDEINYLRKLAKVNETTLIEAQSDEMYQVFKKKKEDDLKAEKARLGASRGSGSVKQTKTVSSPGLTPEEHKALWRESMGK